jgi:DNA-binding NarL/FixJ family response regulator
MEAAVIPGDIGYQASGPTGFSESSQGAVYVEPWEDMRRGSVSRERELAVAIIDERSLMRECLATSLRSIDSNLVISNFRTFQDYASAKFDDGAGAAVVLICATWPSFDVDQINDAVRAIKNSSHTADIVLFTEIDDISALIDAVKIGVRGYIPTSASLDVAVKAIHLVAAGGVYIPASAFFNMDRQLTKAIHSDEDERDNMFTARQLSVLEALRSGKANKTIAYELNMCESTVKVHVRNIMKRLKAKNRTEAAFILNNLEKDGKGFRRSRVGK